MTNEWTLRLNRFIFRRSRPRLCEKSGRRRECQFSGFVAAMHTGVTPVRGREKRIMDLRAASQTPKRPSPPFYAWARIA